MRRSRSSAGAFRGCTATALARFTPPLARAGGALRGVATGALRAVFRAVLVAFATTRFVVREAGFALDVDFRLAADVAAVFFAALVPARLRVPRDEPDGFAAFRAAFGAGFRPLERAAVRELFRAAFLVPPAALRLAITAPFFATRLDAPLTLTVTGK